MLPGPHLPACARIKPGTQRWPLAGWEADTGADSLRPLEAILLTEGGKRGPEDW